MNTNRAAVLPLRPFLKVSAPPSTRLLVFKLENLDFVERFAELKSAVINTHLPVTILKI
jgi:hypothetical protein